VSAISTIGGATGHPKEADNSSNPFKKQGNKDQGFFRKQSSVSTAPGQHQLNTPSALGYTSMLFGGGPHGAFTSAARGPGVFNFNAYASLSLADEH